MLPHSTLAQQQRDATNRPPLRIGVGIDISRYGHCATTCATTHELQFVDFDESARFILFS